MIYLTKDIENAVTIRLSELSNNNTDYYLFQISNEFNPYNDTQYLLLNNYTTSSRYDLFYFTLSSTGSTTGGINTPINLSEGQYEYKVYEMSQPTNDPNDSIGVIQEGILIVEIEKITF